jgi:hypothetical protein
LALHSLLHGIATALNLERTFHVCAHFAISKGNTGACQLAAAQCLSMRACCFITETHFFWQAVRHDTVKLTLVSTADQIADVAMKGLT